MIDACIADGDMVLMEPIQDSYSLKKWNNSECFGSRLRYNFKIFC